MVLGIEASRAAKPVKTGTEWYAFNLIQELKKVVPPNVTVRLYARADLPAPFEQLPPNWEVKILNWPLRYGWTTLRLAWEMFTNPPTILFLPCSGFPIWLPAKVVTTIHDIGFDRFPELYKRRQVWYHRRSLKTALKKCALILTISEFTKAELRGVYKKLPKLAVVPLAADRHFTYPVSATEIDRVRRNYNLGNDYIIYIGRLESKKNIGRLVAGWQQGRQELPNLDLVLVGPRGWGSQAIEEEAAQNRNLHLLSWVPAEDLPALLAGARIFLFPTLYEGFGIPIIEAMSVGTPVITSEGGAHSEVADGAALLVDPLNTVAISGAIKKLYSDEETWAKIRGSGLVRSRQFSWQKTATETWSALAELFSD